MPWTKEQEPLPIVTLVPNMITLLPPIVDDEASAQAVLTDTVCSGSSWTKRPSRAPVPVSSRSPASEDMLAFFVARRLGRGVLAPSPCIAVQAHAWDKKWLLG